MKLPKEVFIRVNTDTSDPYLELSETENEICIGAGENTTVGVYVLKHTARATCKMEVRK